MSRFHDKLLNLLNQLNISNHRNGVCTGYDSSLEGAYFATDSERDLFYQIKNHILTAPDDMSDLIKDIKAVRNDFKASGCIPTDKKALFQWNILVFLERIERLFESDEERRLLFAKAGCELLVPESSLAYTQPKGAPENVAQYVYSFDRHQLRRYLIALQKTCRQFPELMAKITTENHVLRFAYDGHGGYWSLKDINLDAESDYSCSQLSTTLFQQLMQSIGGNLVFGICLRIPKSHANEYLYNSLQILHQDFSAQSDINAANDTGLTVLHLASILGDIEYVRVLSSEPSVDINTVDKSGATALSHALNRGQSVVASELLAHESIDLTVGHSPLKHACVRGNKAIVSTLLKSGKIDIDGIDEGDELKYSALLTAVSFGHHEVVSLLLEYSADVTLANCDGNTPLDMAFIVKYDDIISLLIAHCEAKGVDLRQQAVKYTSGSTLKAWLHQHPIRLTGVNAKYAPQIAPTFGLEKKKGSYQQPAIDDILVDKMTRINLNGCG